MESVFVYWDNSNIFHEAQRFAIERREGSTPATACVSTSRTCCGWNMPIAHLRTRRP